MAELVTLTTLTLAFAPAAYASGSSMPWEMLRLGMELVGVHSSRRIAGRVMEIRSNSADAV